MEPKLGPAHAIGGVIAFAIGFVFISAVSAYAYGDDPDFILSTPENPAFILTDAVVPAVARSGNDLIPLYSTPESSALVARSIPANTETFIETCSDNARWCQVRLSGGERGWIDLLTLIDPTLRGNS